MGDSDSEIGEEREGEPELANPTITDARANNAVIASSNAQATKSYPQQQSSSFGRTVNSQKRLVEQIDTIS